MKALLATIAFAIISLGSNAIAQTQGKGRIDIGKGEYDSKCQVCHGRLGKGDGSYAELLKKPASDLTQLKRNNGGVFPVERVVAMIDGREVVKAHGERDMPVWGASYAAETARAAEYFAEVPYNQEMYVRSRILALVDYLNRLQQR